jgi:hypothetical protein
MVNVFLLFDTTGDSGWVFCQLNLVCFGRRHRVDRCRSSVVRRQYGSPWGPLYLHLDLHETVAG